VVNCRVWRFRVRADTRSENNVGLDLRRQRADEFGAGGRQNLGDDDHAEFDLVGPLPPEMQSYVLFTAGVSANSKVPDAAKQLMKFLTGPTAIPVIRVQGMEPAL